MEETTLSIDQAGPDDVRACATVLTRALGDDDVLRAIIRGENRPPRVTALYVALLESGPIAHRTVDVVRVNGGPIVGVGMWTGPDQDESWLQHPIQLLREIRAIGLRHLSIVRAMDAEYASFRPHYPHWYLTDLAVDPGSQGLGIGSALLRDRLAKVDADGLPAYLEATTPASRRLYERYGFAYVDTINPEGPAAFAMVRPAQAGATA